MSESRYRWEFWHKKGFSKEDAKQKAWEAIDKNRQIFKQKKKDNPTKYDGILTNQLKYWLKKGFSEEESIQKVRERQLNFSKEICIARLGEVDGLKRWEERQSKWQETLNNKSDEEIDIINSKKGQTLENMIKKYGEEEGTVRYNKKCYCTTREALILKYGSEEEYMKKVGDKMFQFGENGYSKIGKKFVEDILDKFNIGIDDHYSCLNKEYFLNYDGRFYMYDFVMNKKMIEFNGDFWHANPKMFLDPVQNLYSKVTVGEIWKKDLMKYEAAKANNFDILIIWASDYKYNYNETMNKVKSFLYNGDED